MSTTAVIVSGQKWSLPNAIPVEGTGTKSPFCAEIEKKLKKKKKKEKQFQASAVCIEQIKCVSLLMLQSVCEMKFLHLWYFSSTAQETRSRETSRQNFPLNLWTGGMITYDYNDYICRLKSKLHKLNQF